MPIEPPPTAEPELVRAAGALPWRRRRGRLEVALVHRRAHDDWSWSKGRLDPGEDWPTAAVREVEEETGLRVRLGRPLPSNRYTVVDRSGRTVRREVRYWAGEVVGGDGELRHEIDEVRWLDPDSAAEQLDHDRDHAQLRALVDHAQSGALTTWPLVVVRHANAQARGSWRRDDRDRPLDAVGHERARRLVPLLDAFGVERLVTSSALRCVQTLEPYAAARGLELRTKGSLTEETFAADPDRAVRRLRKVLDRGTPSTLCTHGPLLPTLLDELGRQTTAEVPDTERIVTRLVEAADRSLAKGELLVCHVVGRGAEATVVDVESYRP